MSYLADFCKMTSSTGGTGALTLTAQTGYPALSDVITGTRLVSYAIAEYTTSGKTTLSKAETGIGSYVASTGVLTRTSVKSTWSGSAYLPKFGTSTAPTAISFGSTAANIDVTVSPIVADTLPVIPFSYGTVASVSDGLGVMPGNSAGFGDFAPATGVVYYSPTLVLIGGMYSKISFRTRAALTGGTPTIDCAIYEISSTGVPGKQLVKFTQVGSFQANNTTFTSSAIATPIYLAPGWYWQAFLYIAGGATGTCTIRGITPGAGGPLGTLFGGSFLTGAPSLASQTVLNDPASAPTAAGSVATYPLMLLS